MNVFGIGLPEMAIIFIVALLVFGPKKLPEIGRSFGKALRSFQDATKEFESEFKQEVEKVERVVKEPMTATIEPPEPKAIDAGTIESTRLDKTDDVSEYDDDDDNDKEITQDHKTSASTSSSETVS